MVAVAETQKSRPDTEGISACPLLWREWAREVPVRFLAVIEHIFCLLTAKLLFILFPLTESSYHNTQLPKCYLSMSKSNPSLVPGVLLYVPIKKFYQPALKSHGVLAYVLLLFFFFWKIYKILFSTAMVDSWCLFEGEYI